MFEGPLQRLIDELARLPGVGKKSAQRMAFHLLAVEEADARRLAQAISDLRDQLGTCRRCFNVTSCSSNLSILSCLLLARPSSNSEACPHNVRSIAPISLAYADALLVRLRR